MLLLFEAGGRARHREEHSWGCAGMQQLPCNRYGSDAGEKKRKYFSSSWFRLNNWIIGDNLNNLRVT